MKEIGSEFWTVPGKYGDIAYLLAGRTALEYIIREILARTNICSVLLPSYCCHTMIEPFVRHNIHVRFYDVFFDDDKVAEVYKKHDFYKVFFLCRIRLYL